jgi:hypothetical protein
VGAIRGGAVESSDGGTTRGVLGPLTGKDFRKRRFSSQYPAREFARMRCSLSKGKDLLFSILDEGLMIGAAMMT